MRPALASLLAALAAASLVASPASGQVRFNGEAGGATVKVLSWRDIPFRTVVRQQHDYSCGSAALATLLTYHYGRPTSEREAFTEMYDKGDQPTIRRVGFSMLDMKRFLASHGVRSQGYRLTLDDIAQAKTPVVALIDLGPYRHFVVIKGVSQDEVLVGDPALGLRRFSRGAFGKMWNGVALAIEDRYVGPAAFNRAEEWRPWAVAPLRQAAAAGNVASLTDNQFTLYQITPIRVLDPLPGGPS